MTWKYFIHESSGEQLAFINQSECPVEYVPQFVQENGYLPSDCINCYKPLIFWKFDSSTTDKFNQLLDSLDVGVEGKYNDEIVVFYTDSLKKVMRLTDILTTKLTEFGINGRFQWRVSCKQWQTMYPEYFISTKKLSDKAFPPTKKMLSIDEWLTNIGAI